MAKILEFKFTLPSKQSSLLLSFKMNIYPLSLNLAHICYILKMVSGDI